MRLAAFLLLVLGSIAGLAQAVTFQDWQAASFTTEQLGNSAASGPTSDPDGDGVANLHEYAFFGQPLVSDQNLNPALSQAAGHLVLTYRERHALTDVAIRLQGSDTLTNWITYNSVTEADRETFTDYDEVTVIDPQPFDQSRRFLRLRVELLPPVEPQAPTQLSLKVVTPTSWSVGWTDPNVSETAYAVEHRLPTNVWQRLGTLGADTGGWQHTAANYQTSMTYRVVAIGTGGAEAASAPITLPDTDSDGIPDALELGEGYKGVSGTYASEPDQFSSTDSGVSDGWLAANGFNPASHDASLDTDEDGLSDAEEAARGTNPNSEDTDGDGVNDPDDGWPLHAWLKTPPLPETGYAVMRLRALGWPGDTTAAELDDLGNVLNSPGPASGYARSFVFWNAKTKTAQTFLMGYSDDSIPYGMPQPLRRLGDAGHVIGFSYNTPTEERKAAIWTSESQNITQIGQLGANGGSVALAVNKSGAVVGFQSSAVGNDEYYGGARFDPDSWLGNTALITYGDDSLPLGYAPGGLIKGIFYTPSCINNTGLVGVIRKEGDFDELRSPVEILIPDEYGILEDNVFVPLPILQIRAITDGSPVVVVGSIGWAHKEADAWVSEEFLVWDPAAASKVDGSPTWINDRLEGIIGNKLIRNGIIRPLGVLIPPEWTVSNTRDINNHGVILANATRTLDDQGLPITNPQPEPVLLVPVELTISHPVVEAEEPIEYVVNADVASVELTASVLPAADGTVVAWEIEAGSAAGALSHAESLTTNGFAKTTLTTSTAVGATYRVKARVKKLILPTLVANATPVEFDFDNLGYSGAPHLRQTTDEIKVVPGFVAAITTTRETLSGEPATSLPSDGKSQIKLIATFTDAFGQPVAENTPVRWHVAGLGSVTPIDEVTDADGKARATLTSGDVAADQKVTIEADTFDVVETIANTVVTGTLSATSSSLDLANNESTTLTVSVPTAVNDTPVRWITSMGEIVDAADTVQSGQATATLRTNGGRTGNAQVTASVGGAIYAAQVAFTSSAPISIEVDNPVIVGDASVAGVENVPRLNGTNQSVSYPTSASVLIKAPAYPGYTATVNFGEAKPLKTIRYRFDQITGVVTPDESGDYPATVSGATLDTANRHEGAGSLFFDAPTDIIGIPHHADLNLQAGMVVSVWARATAAQGTLVSKSGEYELALDTNGRVTFAVVTSTGTQTVTGATMPTGRWVNVRGEYTAAGRLKLTVDGTLSIAGATGTAVTGTAMVVVGEDYEGWLDALTLDMGRQFVLGTGLSVGGLNGSNQVVLDANGEATLTLSANGGTTVDAVNPVFRAGVQVSINPQFEAEESVVVTTRQAYAVLDATLGDVRIQSGGTTAPLTEQQKTELLAASLRELKNTGQRSAALLLEPSGTMAERQQYGFRAALWLETVDGAEQVKLVMENVDRLNLTSEQEVQLQEQVMRMLMDAAKGNSDAAAGTELTNAHGELLATLADLSTTPSFQTFTQSIDGREIFVDLADLHEAYGSEFVKDIADFSQHQVAQDPSVFRKIIDLVVRFKDLADTDWEQVAFQNAEEFMRATTMRAVSEEKISATTAYFIGFGWGVAAEAHNLAQSAANLDEKEARRMTVEMVSILVAASKGSQEAQQTLELMVPVWGLLVMNDQANDLAENGQYFDSGIESAKVSIGAVGSVVGVGAMVKGGVTAAAGLKSAAKAKKGGPPPLPASFGRASPGKPYRDTFLENNPKLQQIADEIEVHHAVEQGALKNFPSVVSKSEIDSLQNLRGIKKGTIDPLTGKEFHRSTIRKHWNEFYRRFEKMGRDPTKQELLDYATKIDDLYGHLFTPPIR